MSPLRIAKAAYLAPSCEDCGHPARHRPDYAVALCDGCCRRRVRSRRDALDGTGGPESPDAGVALYRLWLYDVPSLHRASGSVTMRVRSRPGRHHSTSHGGTIGNPEIDPAERLNTGARLDPVEAEVLRRQAAGERNGLIALALRISGSQLERVVTRANRKLAEYAAVLRQMALG